MSAPAFSHRSRRWLWAGLALTVAKLWLTRAQTLTVDEAARPWLEAAAAGVQGRWPAGLAPAFPLWLATTHTLGLGLLFANQVLSALAAAICVRALRPALASEGAAFALYAVLLCNPMSFDAASFTRPGPAQIAPALALLVFACGAGLALRWKSTWPVRMPWLAALAAAGVLWASNGTSAAQPGAAPATLPAAADFVVSFKSFSAHAPASTAGEPLRNLARDLAREKISPPPGDYGDVGPGQVYLDLQKAAALQRTGKWLRQAWLILFLAGQLVLVLRIVQSWRSRTWAPLLLVAGAAWVPLVGMIAVGLTSGGALAATTFAGAYAFVCLQAGATWIEVGQAWRPAPR